MSSGEANIDSDVHNARQGGSAHRPDGPEDGAHTGNGGGPDGRDRSGQALSQRHYIWFAAALSVATNLLMLVAPLYMLQVYDRVLTSSSYHTLLSLSLIAVFLLGIYAFAEAGRRRALAAYGRRYADSIGLQVAKRSLARGGKLPAESSEPTLQDVSRLQNFFLGGTILPVLDLPFSPFFLALMFLLHPLIGLVGVVGAALLIGMAILSERATSEKMEQDQQEDMKADRHLTGIIQGSNAVNSMGMRHRMLERWHRDKMAASAHQLSTASTSGYFTGSARSVRQILQTIVLGTGAFLALNQQVSPGAIVAGSIIMGRGLQPIDQVVGAWRQISLARDSWRRLRGLTPDAVEETVTPTQQVDGPLAFHDVAIAPPGVSEAILAPFSLTAESGRVYGLVGASGSGKTTMMQTMAGLWNPLSGHVTLGNRDIFAWPDEDRGRFIGYLPQRVELLPGTIGDNICRFTDAAPASIDAVVRASGAHEVIAALGSYDQMLGPGGIQPSAGQQQCIGIARAFFGDPHLLLLDEPTANLDGMLVTGFIKAVTAARDRGAIVIIATHDSRILPHLDIVVSTRDRKVSVSRKEDLVKQLRTVKAPTGGVA